MTNRLFVVPGTALCVSLGGLMLGTPALDAKVPGINLPPGSYLKSCSAVTYTVQAGVTDRLGAQCNPASNATAMNSPVLTDAYTCEGDIANINGMLTCSKNAFAPRIVQARKLIGAQAAKWYGWTSVPEDAFRRLVLDYIDRDQTTPSWHDGSLAGMEGVVRANQQRYADGILTRAYQTKLMRAPTAAERAAWQQKLLAKSHTYQQILDALVPIVNVGAGGPVPQLPTRRCPAGAGSVCGRT